MNETQRDLAPGTTLGHFEILDLLGAGGMGTVYRARDSALQRVVALKILPAELFEDEAARARFLREAHLASQLTHPNIATIHEMAEEGGVLFIAMELVPGRNLKQALRAGSLPMSTVLSIGVQVCEALGAAHKLGIVHRDIKSSNIMMTPDGLVKVLDFGLAKALSEPNALAAEADATPLRSPRPARVRDSADPSGMTLKGTALGTPPYMSPEQASGHMVDGRSDIFSLGVVLYEAASGELPFRGGSDPEVLEAVKHATPPVPRRADGPILDGFLQVLNRCLAKKPEERYASAGEAREALERVVSRFSQKAGPGSRTRVWLASAIAVVFALSAVGYRFWGQPGTVAYPHLRTIGVLPFENVSGNAEENYLASAVPLELTSRLGQVPTLKVVPWTFMRRYREKSTSLGQIRQESGADAVLEGAVALVPSESGGRRSVVRIQTQLFDTETGLLLWSDSIERELGGFLRVRGEIAQQIAALLRVQLAQGETLQIASSRVVESEAMASYLRGRQELSDRTEASLNRAVEHFQAAVQKDSEFAEAYVGMADAYSLLSAYWGVVSADRAYALAVDATGRALAIDATLGDAWAAQAFAHYALVWDWSKALQEFQQALSLAPHSADVHHWYADYLTAIGHHEEALVHSRLAESRSPLSPVYGRRVAWTLYSARRFDEAVDQLKKTLRADPDFVPAKTLLARALVQVGRYEEAVAELRAVGDSYSAMLAQVHATAGKKEEARAVLEKLLAGETLDPRLPFEVGLVYAALGEMEQAMEWLEKGFQVHDPNMVSVKTNPLLDPLRGDERFEDLMRRLDFPP
ncbi:MAG TPA: protein kinase [Vicinamibacteria bacterium]|nr:protein kinase [Vicinamibacteria bacterium]